MKTVLDNLAEHEFMVGRFYLRYGIPGSAVERFDFLDRTYPDYSGKEKLLYHLGLALGKMGQVDRARSTFDQLRKDYPKSSYLKDIPELAERKPAPPKETKGT
jgi:outer membrane protein assembly factor BamD (BamD/ComL family)